MPHDSPLLRGHTLGSDEGRMQHTELMDLVTKLSDGVVALETDLKQTKKVYGAAFTKLIKKVKRLEKKDKLSRSRRKLRLVLSNEEGSDSDILAQEDPSKQGRKIAQIDEDEGITLVQMGVSTTSIDFTMANVPVTTTGAKISTVSLEVKTTGDSVDDIVAESDAESLVYIKRSATKTKDKAIRLQDQLNEEERQRIASVQELASSFNIEEWENIQARGEADEEITARLQVEEQGELTIEERSIMFVELMDKRKKYFAIKRQLRRYSFDELKALFETTMRRVSTFVPIESEDDKAVPELVGERSKRHAEEELGLKLFVIKFEIYALLCTSDIAVPPSSYALCEDLRSACDREHTKVLELEAEVLKQQKMVIESEKRNSYLQKTHIDLQLKFQNYKQCIDTSSASNAIFEINKLRKQLQGKDDTIRNLDAQISIMKVLNVGSTEGSCDQQALETDRTQLKDAITSVRIQNDGFKAENVNLKRHYEELSKSNAYSRSTFTTKDYLP
ncbi:hypothetical protein Tco_0281203 [Tanacetum coccineum]